MSVAWLSQGEQHVPAELNWLTPREAARAARMRYPKRRNDFLLGRWTAKSTLARTLDLPSDPASLAAIEVWNASDGAPEPLVAGQPAAAAISMTDRAGWGVCLVDRPGVNLGCDLELVEPRTPAFVRDWLTPPEQDLVYADGGDPDERANLIWSAKESALKVLRTGLRRDTRSVEVSLTGDTVDGWAGLSVRAAEGEVFPGWWRRYGVFLLTVAADVEIAPPASLDEPPGLHDAEPTHTWMAHFA